MPSRNRPPAEGTRQRHVAKVFTGGHQEKDGRAMIAGVMDAAEAAGVIEVAGEEDVRGRAAAEEIAGVVARDAMGVSCRRRNTLRIGRTSRGNNKGNKRQDLGSSLSLCSCRASRYRY